MNGTEVLNLPLDPAGNELGAGTVREYMAGTLAVYFDQDYAFDGKYAFLGNWSRPIVWALADTHAISGHWELDDGKRFSFEESGRDEGSRRLINKAIEALGMPPVENDVEDPHGH